MNKKAIIYLLMLGMLLGTAACKPQESGEESKNEESRSEESKPEDATREPEIFFCRVSKDLEPGQKVDQAIHLLGKQFLDSRVGTEDEAEDKIKKYGYCLQEYRDYGVGRIYEPGSPEFRKEEQLKDMTVQADGQTWVVAYNTVISRWGREMPSWSGPKFEYSEWTLGDWWIIHQEDTVFMMMSYTDYQRVGEIRKEYKENPFAAYSVQAEEIPEAEYWRYNDQKDLVVFGVTPSSVSYCEPLRAYLYNSSIVFEYEAETEDSSEQAVNAAVLKLGELYLEELCSREYDPWMGERYIRPKSEYYISAYKDLRISRIENSTERTVEKLAEAAQDGDSFRNEYSHVPGDHFFPSWPEWSKVTLKASENTWVVDYLALIKSEDPIWGTGETFTENIEAGVKLTNFIVVREGRKYSLIPYSSIVTEKVESE